MSETLIKEVRKALAGKAGRLEDQELEALAQEITKLGFKIGFARSYAYGPTLMKRLSDALEEAERKLAEIRAITAHH
jgi:hypothetical protein